MIDCFIMSESSTYTFQLDSEQIQKLKAVLEGLGYEFRSIAYAHFGASKGKLSLAMYQSGKLVVQGKESKSFIEFILEPEVTGVLPAQTGNHAESPEQYEPHIGIDESGKGDFFGPLVIAAVYVDRGIVEQLMAKGVRDSKLIKSDQKARALAVEIKRVLGRKWSVISLEPAKYNELYGKFKNLNRLLAWGHCTVLENVLEVVPDCPRALSDQFADERLILNQLKERGKKIKMEQRTKAESDVAVAAASILARAAFLEGLEKLGREIGVELPKGASGAVKKRGEEIAAKHGEVGLRSVSKSHFKTFQECLNLGLDLSL